MSKFTPGPWRIINKELSVEIESPKQFLFGALTVCTIEAAPYVGRVAEDARLIASAPDMWEALQLCVNAFGGTYEDEKRAFEAGMAALAKAEGK